MATDFLSLCFWMFLDNLLRIRKNCSRFALYTLYTKGPTQASRHSLRCWSNLVVQMLHVLPQLSYGPCLLFQCLPQTFWHHNPDQSTTVWSHFYGHERPQQRFRNLARIFFTCFLHAPVIFPVTEISVDTLQGLSGRVLEVCFSIVHQLCVDDLVHVVEPPSNHSIHRVDGPLHFTHEADTLLELLTIQAIVSSEVDWQQIMSVLPGPKVGKVGDAIYHPAEAGGNRYTCSLGDSHQALTRNSLLLRPQLLKSTSLSKDQARLMFDCRRFAPSHTLIKFVELLVHVVLELADSLEGTKGSFSSLQLEKTLEIWNTNDRLLPRPRQSFSEWLPALLRRDFCWDYPRPSPWPGWWANIGRPWLDRMVAGMLLKLGTRFRCLPLPAPFRSRLDRRAQICSWPRKSSGRPLRTSWPQQPVAGPCLAPQAGGHRSGWPECSGARRHLDPFGKPHWTTPEADLAEHPFSQSPRPLSYLPQLPPRYNGGEDSISIQNYLPLSGALCWVSKETLRWLVVSPQNRIRHWGSSFRHMVENSMLCVIFLTNQFERFSTAECVSICQLWWRINVVSPMTGWRWSTCVLFHAIGNFSLSKLWSKCPTSQAVKTAGQNQNPQASNQWMGLRENLQETIDFPIKYGAFL